MDDAQKQTVFFDDRFLDRYVGSIISDPATAIVELVANAWDAYATRVDITWPRRTEGVNFVIRDNGKGMTGAQFEKRWKTLDYNRLEEEGSKSSPPDDLRELPPRSAYGRNGRGRHAAFKFSNPYRVRTWRDGTEWVFEVRRGIGRPFDIQEISSRYDVVGHGTEISATSSEGVSLDTNAVRAVIGARFLADPNFQVAVDGALVTFEDVPTRSLRRTDIDVPGYGAVQLVMIDAERADRTTRHHGIAWRVNSRLVGAPGWGGFEHERILDGRTTEAKRFQFLVSADLLADVVSPDWSGFDPDAPAWHAVRDAVHAKIGEYLAVYTAERRRTAKEAVRRDLNSTVRKLPPVSRDRWSAFVDEVVDTCPSIGTDDIGKVASILANLELSGTKYGLLNKLHDLPPGDLDALYKILDDWTVRLAKDALDEIQSRLKLIEDLDRKLRDASMDEVADLQPLFESSLWVFGPEFESLEFTSNRGMTEVIRKLFGAKQKGTRQRPDFVMLPDGSVGLYGRDAHDLGHEVSGVARLVIAEIKRPGVVIGGEQKSQVWRYVSELLQKGLVTKATEVTGYVLGSAVDPIESGYRTELDGRVTIIPMSYDVFIRRAEKRMLGLRKKLAEAPFLKQHFDTQDFLEPAISEELDLARTTRAASA